MPEVCSAAAGAPIARITVEAANHPRVDTPVSVSLKSIAGIFDGPFYFEEVREGARDITPYTFDPADPCRLCWILSGRMQAGEKRRFEIMRSPTVIDKFRMIQAEKSEGHLDIRCGAEKILRYHDAIVPPPAGASRLYERSGFIHPLWSPQGSVLTEIQPPDHIHHTGVWMAWTATEFEGRKVDFWNLGEGQGTVRFVKYLSTTSGPVFGGFRALHEHVVLDPNKPDKVALNDVWDVRVYNVGGPEKGCWLWDFVSTQRCAGNSPLRQLEYRYGGLGFRATSQWQGDNCDYLTSEGRTKKDGNATRARWCDAYGMADGRVSGLTMMSHPDNFRHPEPLRIWPAENKFVFYNFCPSQLGGWSMEPGTDYVFRYRFFVHQGRPDVAEIERLWYDFAEPPKVTVELVQPGGNEADE